MVIINIVGGFAVLGSYAWCIFGFPEIAVKAWGGVPADLRPVYTISMLAAAVGYFPFTGYLLLQIQPEVLEHKGPFSFSLINWLYGIILIPSVIWMPATLYMVETPSASTWLLIRVVLAVVGLGSLGMLYVVAKLRRHGHPVFFWLALLGIILFNLQTTVLDALVWTAYYPFPSVG